MDLKDLLLFVDAGAPCDGRLELALGLAERHRAALTALCLCGAPAPTIAEGYAVGPSAAAMVIARRDAEVARQAAPLEAKFQSKVAARAVDRVWAPPAIDPSAEDVALLARIFDLAIVGQDASARTMAEQIVLLGGAPCLLVGEAPTPSFDRVVVAWDGSRPAMRAVRDSLPLLKAATAVRLITVGSGGVDPAHLHALEVQRHLRLHGVEARFEQVEPGPHDIGAALLREADHFGAGLLVLGAYGHGPAAEAIFGGVTRSVLAHAKLPVFVSH